MSVSKKDLIHELAYKIAEEAMQRTSWAVDDRWEEITYELSKVVDQTAAKMKDLATDKAYELYIQDQRKRVG
jgi:hypothetical protein